MARLASIEGPGYWRGAVAALKEVRKARERKERRQRRACIKEVVGIYLEAIEEGGAVSFEMVDPGRALMHTMSRAEQIEMLAAILRRVEARDRDDALELITTLAVYAKRRANAPCSEIASVSMFDAVIRKCAGVKRRFSQRPRPRI